VKSQAVPLQVVASAPVGFGQATHDVVPQLSTLLFMTQTPPQSWVPAGHTAEQGAAVAMHVPAQSFIPAGQAGTQAVASQVTVPPVGA
jgi:hypothetical protein